MIPLAQGRMTLAQFFRQARRGRKWEITRNGSVRCQLGKCPLAAVANTWGPDHAARILGLRSTTAWKIAKAADHADSRNRRWLLRNLGIK